MKNTKLWLLVVTIVFPTLAFAVPQMPENFEIDPDSFSITVSWDANPDIEDDEYDTTDGYYIYYWVTDDTSIKWRVDIADETKVTHTIKGLEKNTKYTIEIYAYSGSGGSVSVADQLSDTTNDVDVSIAITDVDEITISIDADGSDITSFTVEVGTSADGNDIFSGTSVDEDEVEVVGGLTSGTYHVKVTLSDGTIAYNDTFSFEDTHSFLSNNSDNIEDGCFIQSSAENVKPALLCGLILIFLCFILMKKNRRLLPLLMLLMILGTGEARADDDIVYKNIFGLKGGWFEATESEQRDVYEKINPFSIFYERMFNEYLSADIDLGYSKSDGAALAASSGSTELVTELEIYPSAISVNINYEFSAFVTGYFGVGGDWWLVEETSALGEFKNEVGGWHAKTGVKIFSDELETLKQVGCLFEASYTQLDKFGNNDFDLGGWKFNFGLMYCM